MVQQARVDTRMSWARAHRTNTRIYTAPSARTTSAPCTHYTLHEKDVHICPSGRLSTTSAALQHHAGLCRRQRASQLLALREAGELGQLHCGAREVVVLVQPASQLLHSRHQLRHRRLVAHHCTHKHPRPPDSLAGIRARAHLHQRRHRRSWPLWITVPSREVSLCQLRVLREVHWRW
jgi:hypothetical protein